MNRVIKFRGMREGKRDWVYGGVYIHDQPSVDGEELVAIVTGPGDFYGVMPETVGQFTGLTDKNCKEIYEGDIVQTWGEYDHGSDVPSETFEEAMPIIFNDGQWWWGDGIDNSCPLNEFDDPKYIEVIGNVHQNPELLTK